MTEKKRAWVYHATEDAKIVDDAQAYYDKGWADSPAKFGEVKLVEKSGITKAVKDPFGENVEDLVYKGLGITKEDPEKIEDASDLSDYLNKEYGMKTNFRMGLKKLKIILKGKLK